MKKNLTIFFVSAALVPAASTITYVSGSGSDSNPCTAASPCRTFAGALANTAAYGTVLALDSSDFGLGLVASVSLPVTIDGGPHGAFVSSFFAFDLNVTIGGPVVFRNLTIVTNGYGINGKIASPNSFEEIVLENVSVISPDTGLESGIAIGVSPGANVVMKNVVVRGGGSAATILPITQGPFNVTVEQSEFSGAYFGASTTGEGLYIIDGNATIRDSSFLYNGQGVVCQYISIAPSYLIEHSLFSGDYYGLSAENNCNIKLSNSVFSGNATGINGGTVISYRNNVFTGNGTDGAPTMSTSLK